MQSGKTQNEIMVGRKCFLIGQSATVVPHTRFSEGKLRALA